MRSLTKTHIHLISIAVTNPVDYEALRRGEIGGDNDIIVVDWRALPNVLAEPIHYWNKTYGEISFVSEPGQFGNNVVVLHPRRQSVGSTFYSGDSLTLGIPPNYTNYLLNFYVGSIISTADVDYILQWNKAVTLEVFDDINSDIAFQLSNRIDYLSTLQSLETLSLNIHLDTYQEINLQLFLEKIPILKLATFFAKDILYSDLSEYTYSQLTLKGWECISKEGYGRPYIQCSKIEN